MKFLNSIIADWQYGKASSKIKKEQYREAIEILRKVLELEKNSSPTNAITLFDLGYCYFKCSEKEEALSYFSKSYGIYKQNKDNLRNMTIYSLLSHYSYLLKEKGDYELASQISLEAERLKEALEKEGTSGTSANK